MQAKERPISMRAPMVRALQRGWKTQTRRPCKQAVFPCGTIADAVYPAKESGWVAWQGGLSPGPELEEMTKQRYAHGFQCPYGQPGDYLWVRETYVINALDELVYRADLEGFETRGWGWKSGRFMPRNAARIILKITDVYVERLFDISEDDAKAEGMDPKVVNPEEPSSYVASFLDLWNDIHGGKRKIAHDCFVWVIHFKVVQS